MEKNSTEDEFADSGAETGGSLTDYSPMSSASSDLSMGDQQDPFLVSVHIITDPGQAKSLQRAADQVLSWVHPDLPLFRVSERAPSSHQRHRPKHHVHPSATTQPSLAVILFIQEENESIESIKQLHGTLQKPPWKYHHTERVNGRGLMPLSPTSQDFFTLAPGTPLWALRQVHYGKEIVRFTVYCRYESYADMVRFYRLLLRRRLAQKKEDFCFCVVYSNPDTEIQLSFKRLPWGQSPTPMDCAVMEIRVWDVGGLVPLLPHPCTPISDVRWQTEDYDGNKILLQVQNSRHRRRHTVAQFTHLPPDSTPIVSPDPAAALPPFGRGPASYRNRRYHRNSSRSSRAQTLPTPHSHGSQNSLPLLCEKEESHPSSLPRDPEAFRAGWTGHRTRSLFSLPLAGGPHSTCPSPSATLRPRSSSSLASLVYRVNVDTLVGAEETDVDTGQKLTGSSLDLSVTSAYSRPQLRTNQQTPRPPRPLSAPLQDINPSLSEPSHNHIPTSVRQPPVPLRTSSMSIKITPTDKPHPPSVCLSQQGTTHSGWEQCGNGPTTHDNCKQEQIEEDEQEFYI
ncbi:protein FAM124A [Chanos chanos]|uniref:Protein FAM124A n=1 Tax=Chanos chanos TaxID=29144 RepID=A0A6J2WI43_CHACN|nr:protein FAM124A [Chanos chanos]